MVNLNLIDVHDDLVDDGNILDPVYESKKIANTPLSFIQWSHKEAISIRAKFQRILANTNVWLT